MSHLLLADGQIAKRTERGDQNGKREKLKKYKGHTRARTVKTSNLPNGSYLTHFGSWYFLEPIVNACKKKKKLFLYRMCVTYELCSSQLSVKTMKKVVCEALPQKIRIPGQEEFT